MSAISNASLAGSSIRTATAPVATIKSAVVLTGRLFFSAIFLLSGLSHFSAKTIGYAAANGVPFASLAVPASGILAFIGALSILLGHRVRAGAWLLVLFLVPVTLTMHNFWSVSDPMVRQMQMINFMKNLSMLGGALLITQYGAGPWSLETKRER
jgi:putative oxidoreductase